MGNVLLYNHLSFSVLYSVVIYKYDNDVSPNDFMSCHVRYSCSISLCIKDINSLVTMMSRRAITCILYLMTKKMWVTYERVSERRRENKKRQTMLSFFFPFYFLSM